MTRVRILTCCCCGEGLLGRQWWNRDTGYGLCKSCIAYCSKRMTPEDMKSAYGVRGHHYDCPEDTEGAERAAAKSKGGTP